MGNRLPSRDRHHVARESRGTPDQFAHLLDGRVLVGLSSSRSDQRGTNRPMVETAPLLKRSSCLVGKPTPLTPSALYQEFQAQIGALSIEHLRVIYLNPIYQPIANELVAVGSTMHVSVSGRAIIVRALALDASGLILAHNHPSGDVAPSHADIAFTRRMAVAAGVLDINLIDHIIVGKSNGASFRSLGLL